MKWLEIEANHGTAVAMALAEDYVECERANVRERPRKAVR